MRAMITSADQAIVALGVWLYADIRDGAYLMSEVEKFMMEG
jgi:hypothetical protein